MRPGETAVVVGNRVVVLGEGIDLQSVPDLDAADLIVTFQLSDEMQLIERKLPALYFHRYAQSGRIWKDTVAAATEWLETWPTMPILNGESALRVFGIEDTSLWWFVYDAIWEAKNGFFDTFYQAKTFLALAREFKPAVMVLRGTFDFNVHELIGSISKLVGFELRTESLIARVARQTSLASAGGKFNLLGRYILLRAARGLSRKDSLRPITFFLEHGSKAVERSRNGIEMVSDHYLDGLEEYMIQNRSRIRFISLNTPQVSSSPSANLVSEAKRTVRNVYLPWIFYYSLADLRKGAALVRQYLDKVLALEQDPAFRDSMIVDGIDIYPLLRQVFRSKLPGALALVHVELTRARRFVERERPRVVFHVKGLSPTAKAISYICTQLGIPTLAPQLGIISPELPVNTGFLVGPGYDKRLLCEYLVWGPYYKELVVARGYPESLVKTVGFWRAADQGGTESGKYVLYAAGANTGKLSYILSFEEEICTIRMIRRVLPASESLIVKLHPSLEYEAYRSALEDIADKITLVGGPGSPTIEEFLPKAKIVVGKASTVLVQALIMKKPVVVVNFASELNFLGFEGVPFAATPDDFARVVKAILDGHNTTDFDLRRYCDPVGKESVSRIVSEIEKENRAA